MDVTKRTTCIYLGSIIHVINTSYRSRVEERMNSSVPEPLNALKCRVYVRDLKTLAGTIDCPGKGEKTATVAIDA